MNSGRKRNVLGATQVAERDPTALAHAVDLIFRTCCLAGAPSVIVDILDQDELNAIGQHNTAALFDLLVVAFSYQGTSDVVAHDYMQRHGTPTWRGINSELSRGLSQAVSWTHNGHLIVRPRRIGTSTSCHNQSRRQRRLHHFMGWPERRPVPRLAPKHADHAACEREALCHYRNEIDQQFLAECRVVILDAVELVSL
jgi:hypothetical protein